MGKRTAQKDTTIDITSDSQVNSNFPYRWSTANLSFNNYFYLFLYLFITRITINNNAPHLKSPKNQNRRAAFVQPANHVCFILVLTLIFMFLRFYTTEIGVYHANRTTKCLMDPSRIKGKFGRPESIKKGNNQELVQSNPTAHPKNKWERCTHKHEKYAQ